MKIFLVSMFSFLALLPVVVLAVPNIGLQSAENIAVGAGYEKATELTLSQTIGRYIKVALSMVGTIFLVLTVYAGFLWMTASGNEEKVTEAKSIITRASLGLLITLSAFAITAFVLAAVGATQSTSSTVGGALQPQGCQEGYFSCWWQGFKKQASQPW
jgi:lysylphosphatidylglycerol synthetase-like protein (DUF2156 family)